MWYLVLGIGSHLVRECQEVIVEVQRLNGHSIVLRGISMVGGIAQICKIAGTFVPMLRGARIDRVKHQATAANAGDRDR